MGFYHVPSTVYSPFYGFDSFVFTRFVLGKPQNAMRTAEAFASAVRGLYRCQLLHGYRFCKVAGLVDVKALFVGGVKSEQL